MTKGRLYVRCPHCEAEEPSRVRWAEPPLDETPLDETPLDQTPLEGTTSGGTSQQCSVCGIDVLVSEATTFLRS